MIYTDFKGLQLPLLGFGAMRLPMLPDGSGVDEALTEQMVDYAMAHGVNYFDTAHPYHGGKSEGILGKALRKYPRGSYYLADKYPGHQLADHYDPAYTFEEQLQRCGVEYFDFYLLHNVCELSMPAYTDPRWGIVDYFVEQKRLGRIRHLGFSTHAGLDCLKEILSRMGDQMDFCQIQFNYLDWTLQDAQAKYELLRAHGLPVWVMEPVRGGKLAQLSEANAAKLEALRPGATPAEWAFRWVQGKAGVQMLLSGMSNMQQIIENVATFETLQPLNAEEEQAVYAIADSMKNSVPCTACRYCVEGCPMGLDIPMLLSVYNELRFAASGSSGMRIEALPDAEKPSACIGCGACTHICPQHIDIPAAMQDLAARLAKQPSWLEISRQREREAQQARAMLDK